MIVVETSPQATPELFFLPREVDKVYPMEDGVVEVVGKEIVYDVPSETLPIKGGIARRRRCAGGGIQEMRIYPDRAELWHLWDEYVADPADPDKVKTKKVQASQHICTACVYMQTLNWETDEWEDVRFFAESPAMELDEKGKLQVKYKKAGIEWNTDMNWEPGNPKQTFYAKSQGDKVRVQSRIKVYDKEKLIVNYDDFTTDLVDDQELNGERVITFAPDGVDDEILVDPWISLGETASTITVYCPDDAISFTISTADARVIDTNAVRVWVQETNIDWFIYKDRMIRYGSGSTTGMSGNDYTAETIETGWLLYPLNSTVEANKDWIAWAYREKTFEFDPTKGTLVDDLAIAEGTEGWAGDLALHVDPDSNGEADITWDYDRPAAKLVIHEGEICSGSPASPTEHLMDWFEFDDTWVSSTVTAKKGNNAVYRFSSDLSGKDCSIAAVTGWWRGGSFDLAGASQVDLNDANYGNSFFQKGTVIITFTPQYNLSSANQNIFQLYIDSNNHITMRWAGSSYPYLSPWFRVGGSNYYLEAPDDTDLQRMQRPTTIHIAWDLSRNFACFAVNGKICEVLTNITATPGTGTPTGCVIGSSVSGSSAADIILHEFKSYDECIIPYGIPFVDLPNECANPHANVLSYLRGDEADGDSLRIGSGTVDITNATPSANGVLIDATGETVGIQTSGNINLGKGMITFWWKSSTTSPIAQPTKWICASGSDGYFQLYRGSTVLTNMLFDIAGNGSTFTVPNLYDQQWHFFRVYWNESNNWRCVEIDGTRYLNSTAVSFSAPSFTDLGIGNRLSDGARPCEGTIKDFTICTEYNAPLNWSVGVEPRVLPQVRFTDYISHYVGFANTGGTPDSPAGSIVTYGVDGDRVYTRQHTMTEDGIIASVNVYLYSAYDTWDHCWFVVYKNGTLVGKSALIPNTISSNGWYDYRRIYPVSGQSLAFSNGDVLNFGIAWDVSSGTARLGRDDGVTGEDFTYIATGESFDEAPPTSPTFTNSTLEGLLIILQYRVPA